MFFLPKVQVRATWVRWLLSAVASASTPRGQLASVKLGYSETPLAALKPRIVTYHFPPCGAGKKQFSLLPELNGRQSYDVSVGSAPRRT
ncbi:hypothetical protein D3C85_1750970 [compost metagenome]